MAFPGGSDGKIYACNAGDLGSILGSGRFPGEVNDNPPQCSCLGNSVDRGAWLAIVFGSRVRHNLKTKQQQIPSSDNIRTFSSSNSWSVPREAIDIHEVCMTFSLNSEICDFKKVY